MSTATRQVGNCQICERDQKLHSDLLVHHGYTRPGDGYTHGSCPGVDHPPYEVSCDLVKRYKADLEVGLAGVQERLADIREGRVDEFTKTRRSALTGKITTDNYVRGFTDKITFDHELRLLEAETASKARALEGEIKRATARIARWAPKPIRTFEEEQQRAAGDKAARKAARDEARAARDAKKAVTRAKQDALASSRAAIKADFIAKFHEYAKDPHAPVNRAAARRLLDELNKSKFKNWLGRWDLEDDCAQDFIALGLAKADGVRHNGKPYLMYGNFDPSAQSGGGGGGNEGHAWSRARARRRPRSLRMRYGRAGGWRGERERHSLAARKGWLRRR